MDPAVSNEKPAPLVPVADRLNEALTKAFAEEGLTSAPVESTEPAPEPEVAKPEDTPAPPPAETKPEEPALTKLARKQAELRKQKEALAPFEAAAESGLTPDQLRAAAKAKKDGDVGGVMRALGISHDDYIKATVKKPAPDPIEQNFEVEADELQGVSPAVLKILRAQTETINKLKESTAQVEQERLRQTRQQTLGNIKSHLTGAADKFGAVTEFGLFEQVEKKLLDHWNEYKALPGADFKESVEMAAEEVEAEVRQSLPKKFEEMKGTLAKMERLLTKKGLAVKVSEPEVSEAEVKAASGKEASQPLTNTNASRPSNPPPDDRQKRIARLLKDPNFRP